MIAWFITISGAIGIIIGIFKDSFERFIEGSAISIIGLLWLIYIKTKENK